MDVNYFNCNKVKIIFIKSLIKLTSIFFVIKIKHMQDTGVIGFTTTYLQIW